VIDLNWTLVAQVVNFLILVFLLKKILAEPIKKALDNRQSYIEDSIATAEADKAEAATMKQTYHDQLMKARGEAQEIIDKATKFGEQTRDTIIEESKEEATKILKQAQAEIERERAKALADLRNEVASLSVLVAGRIIGQNLDAKGQDKLVEEFINQLDSKGAGGLLC